VVIDKHLMKLRARDTISAAEEAFIRSGVREIMKVRAGSTAVREGQRVNYSTILISGIAARVQSMPDGTSQILELHVPGDFTDLHSFTLKYLDHDVVAISDCSLAVVPHAHLQEMTERFPHLTRVYWFGTNLDASINREWEVSLGSRDALSRMAHVFCELYIRFDLVDLVRGGTFDFPVTQQQLAEMVGITPVHANRTLQQLRGKGLVEFARGLATIPDLDRLMDVARFNPAYLYLERHTRGES
jgi:CRP-like cAMP-binding protein